MNNTAMQVRYLPANSAYALCFGDPGRPADLTIIRLHVSPHTLYMDKNELLVDLALCGLMVADDGMTVVTNEG